MRHPTLAALLLLVGLPLGLRAQATPQPPARAGAGPGAVRGLVLGEGEQPLAAAAVVVVRSEADTAVAAGAMMSQVGRFRVTGLALGSYTVRIAHLGYTAQTRPGVALTAAAPAADLGAVRMAIAAVALQGIEVRAEKAAVVLAPDRTAYATKDMPAASAGTAVDVLRNVPEVDVDMNGQVSLRGNGSVAIHINGRPAPMKGDALSNFLQQFPASRIERVEVIPNPSAKFDPEGMVGILNIVLKDNADLGLSGSLSARAGNMSGGGNGRLAYQRGALTLFGGGGGSANRNWWNGHDLRENLLATPVTSLDQSSDRKRYGRFLSGDLSAELRLNKRSTLYSALNGFYTRGGADTWASYALTDADQVPLERYLRDGPADFRYEAGDASLGFRRVVRPQQDELSVEARASRNGEDSDGRTTKEPIAADGGDAELPAELTLNDGGMDTRELSLQADYTHPVGKSLKAAHHPQPGLGEARRLRLQTDPKTGSGSAPCGRWARARARTPKTRDRDKDGRRPVGCFPPGAAYIRRHGPTAAPARHIFA